MLSGISYWNTAKLDKTAQGVEHSQAVLRTMKDITENLKDCETGQRGFIITGEDRYLDPYKAGKDVVEKSVSAVRELTKDNPKQQERLDALKPLIASKLEELKETIDLRKEKGFDAAQKVVLTDKGKKVMDDIRKVMGDMEKEERDLMQTRSQDAGAAASFTKSTLLYGTLLSCIFMAIAGFLITRSITKPVKRVIAGLSESSEQVASAASQISSSSQQLAEGASEQAASIEETSSSLEEMGSMTRLNAENASNANSLMSEATSVVTNANESMRELITSMNDISHASEETQKIIKTIDEIAFQTNLLALNAAVEAARAGEAGAGFAVVADEVRNLAMRAAEAAKNTADLIEGTVKQIKDGSELVAKTNQAFQQVAQTVTKSGELVGEITAASHEQAQGIEQIGKAVSEMDKVTQQNTASAEETASSSEQMKRFVSELGAMVGVNGNGKDLQPAASSARRSEARSFVRASISQKKLTRPEKSYREADERIHIKGREIAPEKLIPLCDDF